MKKTLLLFGTFSLLAAAALHAQEFRLHPTPPKYIFQDDSICIPLQYQLLSGNSLSSGNTLSLLRTLMPGESPKVDFRIYIGTKDDKTDKNYRKQIPQKSEGYFMKIDKDRIIIAGADGPLARPHLFNDDLGALEATYTHFRLETSLDGKEWQYADMQTAWEEHSMQNAKVEGRKVLKIRRTNISGNEQKVYFKTFGLTEKE